MEATLEAVRRDQRGRNEMVRLRAEGRIPAVLYGGKEPAESVAVDPKALMRILHSDSGVNTLIALKAGWSNDGTTVGNADANVVAVPYPIPAGGHPASVVIGNQVNSPMKNAPHRDLAIALIEESVNNEEAQVFLPDNAGIWIPALKSMLEQWETFDRLGGYASEKAKDIVREQALRSSQAFM